MKKILLALLLTTVFISACSGTAAQNPADSPAIENQSVTRTPFPSPTLLTPNTPRPTITLAPTDTPVPPIGAPEIYDPSPIRISFNTPDGITLRGYFYPAARKNAPVVVMMHQNEGDQSLWHAENSGFIQWLQNWQPQDGSLPTPSAGGALPILNPILTFNVMTFDFRGHGESDGQISEDFSIYLLDAQSAYQAARGLPNVDPNRIVGIGTSIGADAVINACGDICRGAFAISPGSWLGINFAESASAMIAQGKPVRCMYAVNDGPSPATCASIVPDETYKLFGYPGIKHGMTFFVPRKMEADFGKNIIEFLYEATE